MTPFVTAGAGFLLAVLWFDLMFDVQALRRGRSADDLPEEKLAAIAAYYRRVTTEAQPMNRLVALVMLGTVAAVVVQLADDAEPDWVATSSLVPLVTAVTVAGARTVPNARRLGASSDGPARRTELARAILHEHLICLAAIVSVLILQLGWAR